MVDSLPKTIWSSTHHIPSDEELASPYQTAHGKDISNPLIADSFLKTMIRAAKFTCFTYHCSLKILLIFTTASSPFPLKV